MTPTQDWERRVGSVVDTTTSEQHSAASRILFASHIIIIIIIIIISTAFFGRRKEVTVSRIAAQVSICVGHPTFYMNKLKHKTANFKTITDTTPKKQHNRRRWSKHYPINTKKSYLLMNSTPKYLNT